MKNFIFFTIFIFVGFWGASYVDAYLLNASDLLGQLDESDEPVYTRAWRDNQSNPNNIGLARPAGVAVDDVGHRLFIADQNNNRVLIFNLDENNTIIDYEADYVLGQANFTSNTGAVTRSGINNPGGLTYATSSQQLFVSDLNNNRVLVFDLSGGITNGMNASYVLGQANFTSNSYGTGTSTMRYPEGLAYDASAERLFVADRLNNRVLIYDVASITDGEDAVNVLGQANFTSNSYGTGTSTMYWPFSVEYDSENQRLFVAEYTNNRITVFDAASITNGEDAVNVLGQANFTSNGAATTQSGLFNPTGLAYATSSQKLFISDGSNSRVMVFDAASITNGEDAVNVLGQANFTSNTGTVTRSGINNPKGLAYSDQFIFVTDYNNIRVMVFNVSSITNGEDAVNLLGQVNYLGQVDYSKSNQDNFPYANPRGFYYPLSTIADTENNRLFIADHYNSRTLVFNLDSDGAPLDRVADYVLGQPSFASSSAATTQSVFQGPSDFAYDSQNQMLFVADYPANRVLIFDLSGGITSGMNASYVLGQANFTSSGSATTQSGLSYPYGVDYNSKNQNLCVADHNNARVLIFDLSGGITSGMNASYVLGQANFTSNTGAVTQSGMTNPSDCAFDESGDRLFVADYSINRIVVFDLSGGITNGMNASYVLGQTDFVSSGSALTQDGLNYPLGLSYASSSQALYVTEVGGVNRVLIFDTSSVSNGQDAANVLGQSDFASGSSGTTQNQIYIEWDYTQLSYSEDDGKLYLPDMANFRVLLFQLPKITTTSLSDATVGEAYSATISATGGVSPYVCSLASGSLPSGLTLNSDCTITGTPTSNSDYTFIVRAYDSAATSPETLGFWHGRSFTLTVNAAAASEPEPEPEPEPVRGGGIPFIVAPPTPAMIGGAPGKLGAYEPLKIIINDGAETTHSRVVRLKIEGMGNGDAKWMVISEDDNYKDGTPQPYSSFAVFTLSPGEGKKTVFVTLFTEWWQPSDTFSDDITLVNGRAESAKPDGIVSDGAGEEAGVIAAEERAARVANIKQQIFEARLKLLSLLKELAEIYQNMLKNI